MVSISEALTRPKRSEKLSRSINYSLLIECLIGFLKGVAGTLAAFAVVMAVLYFFL